MNLPAVLLPAPSRTAAGVYRRLLGGVILSLLAAAPGCRDQKVTSYRVAKEHDAEPTSVDAPQPGAMPASAPSTETATGGGSAMASIPVETATGAGLAWTAPAEWRPKDLGPMRKGSFTVPGAAGAVGDLSITAFPGAVGGELANINRWRGQLGLDPIEASALAGAATRVVVGELSFTVVDLVGSGTEPQRILGAMVPFGRSMWFFKLSGPNAHVTASKPAFLAFLQTVKAAGPATP